MARRRTNVPPQSLSFGSWISHYLPAWMAVFLVVMPTLFGNVVRSPGVSNIEAAKWLADVCLGMVSFWMWALVTNAHDGRLVRSSGRKEARDERERREELAVILLFLGMTMTFYLLCNIINIPMWAKCGITMTTIFLPIAVLGIPEP